MIGDNDPMVGLWTVGLSYFSYFVIHISSRGVGQWWATSWPISFSFWPVSLCRTSFPLPLLIDTLYFSVLHNIPRRLLFIGKLLQYRQLTMNPTHLSCDIKWLIFSVEVQKLLRNKVVVLFTTQNVFLWLLWITWWRNVWSLIPTLSDIIKLFSSYLSESLGFVILILLEMTLHIPQFECYVY